MIGLPRDSEGGSIKSGYALMKRLFFAFVLFSTLAWGPGAGGHQPQASQRRAVAAADRPLRRAGRRAFGHERQDLPARLAAQPGRDTRPGRGARHGAAAADDQRAPGGRRQRRAKWRRPFRAGGDGFRRHLGVRPRPPLPVRQQQPARHRAAGADHRRRARRDHGRPVIADSAAPARVHPRPASWSRTPWCSTTSAPASSPCRSSTASA
jgi:hypothetical protein